jgi:beta-lactamase regulating signal transducer with metallopeptidase domain
VLCILYVNAAGFLLGLAALSFERTLPVTAMRRWLWCIVIPASIVLPGFYRFRHNWALSDLAGPAAHSAGHHVSVAASIAGLSPEFWTRVEALDPAINVIWQILTGVLVIWAVINAMRVSHIIATGRGGRNSTLDGVPVVITESAGPATVGVLFPRVIVPQWVLTLPVTQRRYVLNHENEHRRAYDATLLFLGSLPIVLAPWNLALWWQLRRLALAVEMDCDNRVVAALGNPRAYGELLLRVAEASSRGPRLQPAFAGSAGALERRLRSLLAPSPLHYIQRYLFPALALVFLAIVIRLPHPLIRPDRVHRTVTPTTVNSPIQKDAR